MPVICFCIGLGALCLYLYHTYGLMFSFTAGLILATLPGSIERSTAGFGDRDAFCLMIGILAVVTHLVSHHVETPRKRLIWTLSSGFAVFLGCMSWEGFGVFLSVIIVIELWRFLRTETAEGLRALCLVGCAALCQHFTSPHPPIEMATASLNTSQHLFSYRLLSFWQCARFGICSSQK